MTKTKVTNIKEFFEIDNRGDISCCYCGKYNLQIISENDIMKRVMCLNCKQMQRVLK